VRMKKQAGKIGSISTCHNT